LIALTWVAVGVGGPEPIPSVSYWMIMPAWVAAGSRHATARTANNRREIMAEVLLIDGSIASIKLIRAWPRVVIKIHNRAPVQ
jgi:hypothetical protein